LLPRERKKGRAITDRVNMAGSMPRNEREIRKAARHWIFYTFPFFTLTSSGSFFFPGAISNEPIQIDSLDMNESTGSCWRWPVRLIWAQEKPLRPRMASLHDASIGNIGRHIATIQQQT
jgi:hypothetical protein